MGRVLAALALALVVLGCEASNDPVQVQLLTGPPDGGIGGCFTNHADGPLVVDPTYGTAIIDRGPNPTNTRATPVAWRPGFTAWRIGSEVEVVDSQGNVVAITGRNYSIAGGYVAAGGSSGLHWPELHIGVFWACDFVLPKP